MGRCLHLAPTDQRLSLRYGYQGCGVRGTLRHQGSSHHDGCQHSRVVRLVPWGSPIPGDSPSFAPRTSTQPEKSQAISSQVLRGNRPRVHRVSLFGGSVLRCVPPLTDCATLLVAHVYSRRADPCLSKIVVSDKAEITYNSHAKIPFEDCTYQKLVLREEKLLEKRSQQASSHSLAEALLPLALSLLMAGVH